MTFNNYNDQDENVDYDNVLTSEQLLTKVIEEKEKLKYYLSKLTKSNDSDVETLATIALSDAINQQESFDPEDNANMWLYKLATNVAIDHIRNKRNSTRIT